VYFDGAEIFSRNFTGHIDNSNWNAFIGGDGWGNNMIGTVDKVRFYGTARSADDILVEYNTYKGVALTRGSFFGSAWEMLIRFFH
jgi:hypothetical protein